MRPIKDARGHFSSLWVAGGPVMIPTTVTTQYKSKARALENAKRDEICRDTEALTGSPVKHISRKIDGVVRLWSGVKANRAE